MREVIIRDLAPGDVDAIVEIALAAWKPIFASFRQILGDEMFALACPDWPRDKERQVRRACEPDSSAMVSVAEGDARVVGFITFYADHESRTGTIGNNAVHPDCQGRGIGPSMYQHAFDRLRELGMQLVTVTTGRDPSHAPARRAYEKAGFSAQFPWVTYYHKL